jgi:hypothetical protein
MGLSRWLPWPVDTAARAAWDEALFWSRRLSPVTPAALSRCVGTAVEAVQRPWLETHRARLADGSVVEYVGNDTILRCRLLSALGARGGASNGRVARLSLHPGVRSSDAAVSMIEIASTDAQRWAADGHLILPHSVNFEVDLGCPERNLWDARKREMVRRIERSGLVAETAGVEALDEFYDDLYVPTCLARHGDSAYTRRRHYVRRAALQGRLLFAVRSGTRVAGLALVARWSRPHTIDALLFGVRRGNYVGTALARDAAYLFGLRWARDACSAERFGLTTAPPLLEHGLLRHKKRWGARAVVSERHPFSIALRIGTASPALWTALADQPFICRIGRGNASRLCAFVPRIAGSDSRAARATPGIDIVSVDPASITSLTARGDELAHAVLSQAS